MGHSNNYNSLVEFSYGLDSYTYHFRECPQLVGTIFKFTLQKKQRLKEWFFASQILVIGLQSLGPSLFFHATSLQGKQESGVVITNIIITVF